MTKAELTADLKRFCGGSFITRKEFAKYMGYSSPKCVDQMLNGLERINGTRYFINEVAENVLKFRT